MTRAAPRGASPGSSPGSSPPNGRTRLLGIVGDPLDHSLSPQLMSEVLRKLGRNLLYIPLPVSVDRLSELVALAPSLGLLGFNVTTPFKETVARLVRPLDRETARTQMVNTVSFGARGAAGCGTDGAGILDCLEGWGMAAEPFGLLGFGATARSLTHRAWRDGRPLAVIRSRRPREVTATLAAWERAARADRRELLGPAQRPEVLAWEASATPRLWISTLPPLAARAHTTHVWLRGLPSDAVVLDLNYGGDRSRLAAAALERGLMVADGRGPLLAQAARSLSFWLREEVDIALFERALGQTRRRLAPSRRRAT